MDLDSYYLGFAEALLFTQAHNDVEGGQQTLTTHLPDDTWDDEKREFIKLPDFEERLAKTIDRLDEDGGVTAYRFLAITPVWARTSPTTTTTRVIEVASTEGHHGLPDWAEGR